MLLYTCNAQSVVCILWQSWVPLSPCACGPTDQPFPRKNLPFPPLAMGELALVTYFHSCLAGLFSFGTTTPTLLIMALVELMPQSWCGPHFLLTFIISGFQILLTTNVYIIFAIHICIRNNVSCPLYIFHSPALSAFGHRWLSLRCILTQTSVDMHIISKYLF